MGGGESGGVPQTCGLQGLGALACGVRGQAVVDVGGCVKSDATVPMFLRGSRRGRSSAFPSLCSSEAVVGNVVVATGVVQGGHAVLSSIGSGCVEAGHEVAVRGPGCVEVLGAFFQLQAELNGVLFEIGDLRLELFEVGWCAES